MSEEEYNLRKARLEEQIAFNESIKCRFVVKRLYRDLSRLTEFYNKSNQISREQ